MSQTPWTSSSPPLDLDSARRDFDAVAELVRSKRVTVEGVILVEHSTTDRSRLSNPAELRRTWSL